MRFHYLLGLFLMACNPSAGDQHMVSHGNINGHRGLRGLYPENSLYGFQKTVEQGYHRLEMDVILTADTQLVVFHDPSLNPDICECDTPISIYELSLDSLRTYTCGTKRQARFPEQELRAHAVPALYEVFEWAQGHALQDSIHFIVEIKSPDSYASSSAPSDSLLVSELLKLVADYNVDERFVLQSFDTDILEEAHRQDKDVSLLYLIEEMGSVSEVLELLSFTPDVVGLYHPLIDEQLVEFCHEKGISVTAWTVNEAEEIERLRTHGVDDIMSDYFWPNKAY